MKCLIVDDDKLSRVSLERLCQKMDNLTVVGTCANGLEALEFLSANKIDLLFLDVEMPELTGVELLQSTSQLPLIIFISSKKEYAVEAFEYKELVVDYIPKPATMPRLLKALERVKQKLNSNESTQTKDYIFVRSDGRFVRIKLDDLLYVENVGDYVLFKTHEEKHLVHGTLKNIAEKLQHPNFLKVHRSFIVNLSKIVDIQDNSVLIDKKIIPVSRAHRNALIDKIDPF
ncbi:MAG: DNA-binding response regulator [Bacteroidetes bacterium]|nr:MAG: DNA-binding response regulator [Bacteroidota bacterium]